MDHSMFDIIVSLILVCIGAVCVVTLLIALIVWAIKTIIRNIVQTKYACSVKYYIQDTHDRIEDYDRRVRSVETEMSEIKKLVNDGKKE